MFMNRTLLFPMTANRTHFYRGVMFMIFLLPICFHLYAQNPDTSVYHLTHNTTGFINRTNDGNSYLVNNNLRFNISKKRFSANTVNSWIYGSQESGLTNNDFSSTLDFNLFKSINKFYYWGLATYDKSFSLQINNRFQTGAGIGYTAIDNKTIYLVFSDGPLYETSQLYDTAQYNTVRNSFRIRYRMVIRKNIILDGTNFQQQSLLSRQDYIIKSTNTLSVKLNTWLSLTVALTYNKLNITRKENLLCNFGFTFDRYF
jgi:hypothetical protein